MKKYNFFICNTEKELNKCKNYMIEEEYKVNTPLNSIKTLENLLIESFEIGKIIYVKKENQIIGVTYYKVLCKNSIYISLLNISKEYRKSKLFFYGMSFLKDVFHENNIEEIYFKADENNLHNNRLYSKFSTPVGNALSANGIPSIKYKLLMKDFNKYMEKLKI